MTYNDAPLEVVEAELEQINAQRDELGQRAKQLAVIVDFKRAEKAAQEKFANMSDTERIALAQVIQATGIPSAERVNGQ